MSGPKTAAGRALLNDFMTGSGMLNRSAPRGSVAEQILAIEAEARQQDGSALRLRLQRGSDRWHSLSEDPIHMGHIWAECPDEYCVGDRAALAALPPSAPPARLKDADPSKRGSDYDFLKEWDEPDAEPPSAPPALDDLTREHRKCGPKYEGCYAHWPMDHCRADGMAWPCDVEHIRARLQEQER